MTRLITRSAMVAMLLFSLAGCATPGGPRKDLRILVLSNGRIRIMKRDVRYADLQKTVKALGGTPATRITISAHWESSDRLLASMRESLISGGYPRVIVAKKKKPEAFLDAEKKGWSPKTKTPASPRPRVRR